VIRAQTSLSKRRVVIYASAKRKTYGLSLLEDRQPAVRCRGCRHTTDALKKHGFGVLTQIDVNDILHKKIGVDFRPYLILGACNPKLAYQALTLEDKIGSNGAAPSCPSLTGYFPMSQCPRVRHVSKMPNRRLVHPIKRSDQAISVQTSHSSRCDGADVRLGSKAALTAPKRHFRITPRNGHHQVGRVSPIGANRRHPNKRGRQLRQPYSPPDGALHVLHDDSFWRAKSGRCQPLVYVRGRFSSSGFADEFFPLSTWR